MVRILATVASLLAVAQGTRVILDKTSSTVGDAPRQIVNRMGKGNKCIDAYSPGGNSEGIHKLETNIVMWKCHGQPHQQWETTMNGEIRNKKTGYCLDIYHNQCKKGQNVILYTCNGQRNQKWTFDEHTKQLKSRKCPSYCMDVQMSSGSKLRNVHLHKCKKMNEDIEDQQFRIEKIR